MANKKKGLLMGLLALCLAIGFETSAFAAAEVGQNINGGTLTGGGMTFASFADVTLNGSLQTRTANWSIANVIDARGTGAGWNVNLTLSQFREYFAGDYVGGGLDLDLNSVSVATAPVVSKVDATSSSEADINTVAVGTKVDTTSPVKLVIAPVTKGMGSFSFTDLGVEIAIPASAYASHYKADAVVALSSAP